MENTGSKTRTTRLELTHEAREAIGAKALREGKSLSRAASEIVEGYDRLMGFISGSAQGSDDFDGLMDEPAMEPKHRRAKKAA